MNWKYWLITRDWPSIITIIVGIAFIIELMIIGGASQ